MQTTLVLVALLASAQAIRAPTPVANATTLNSANSTGMSAYELLVKSIHDECKILCLPNRDTCSQCDVDSHCVSECEVEMYRCHDHNHTTTAGWPPHNACTDAAEVEIKKLANPSEGPNPSPSPAPMTADQWEATRRFKGLLSVNKTTKEQDDSSRDNELGFINKHEQEAINGMCNEACCKKPYCKKVVDSSCVPLCQVAVYTCMDANRKTAEGKKQYEMCEKAAMQHFSAFGENWDSKHPY
eukprot:gnl/TRDRNA2_/TRDRNA2_174385_c2_seq34.p2 gnl/TRDRNA2_/TRDRNA2_174385_c2~~gnl/TRDRNA2_/TRDRNA2_174385_c2_seq34.p2  ORF type:complete len:242 (+),score=57.31 gnl/TRDRNA2_/TRDRNA2_174385_c2_seq34:79-804(+)